MVTYKPLSDAALENIARLLGDCGTGDEITRILRNRNIPDNSGHSTKWRRLYHVFTETQNSYKSSNRVLDFVRSFLTPARFVGRADAFENVRRELNVALAFEGLEYGEDGNFRERSTASTLSEADKRLRCLKAKFQGRIIHAEVLKYCKSELLQENYFHAVFEASKGLAERIRMMSGANSDGAKLVDQVFSLERPILALNSLVKETEQSEHKGFANLLRGCFGAVRNPLAHEPKILWDGEDDAADYLSLISLLHRKLDQAIRTHFTVIS